MRLEWSLLLTDSGSARLSAGKLEWRTERIVMGSSDEVADVDCPNVFIAVI